MAIPPGSARVWSRSETLTPSPWMSSPSTITSPRLMPMRNASRRSGSIPVFRSASARWTSMAQRTDDEIGLKPRARPFLVGLAQAAIAGDIGDHHRGEPAFPAPRFPGRPIDETQATNVMIMRDGAAQVNCCSDARRVATGSLQSASSVPILFQPRPSLGRQGSGGLRSVGRSLTSWIRLRRTLRPPRNAGADFMSANCGPAFSAGHGVDGSIPIDQSEP